MYAQGRAGKTTTKKVKRNGIQNRKLEQRMEKLEQKIDKRNLERERKIDEFLELWKAEQARGKSWLSRILSK